MISKMLERQDGYSNWAPSSFCCGKSEVFNDAYVLTPNEIPEFTKVVKEKNNTRTGLVEYVAVDPEQILEEAFITNGWMKMATWRSNHKRAPFNDTAPWRTLVLFGLVIKEVV